MNRPLTNKQLTLRALRQKAKKTQSLALRARYANFFNLCEKDRKEKDKVGYRVDLDVLKDFKRIVRREEGIAELKKLVQR